MAFVVNVPNVPGVPSVAFAPGSGSPTIDLLVSDAINVFAGILLGQQWGLYLNGFPVILCDNVVALDYRKQYSVSDYPVEQGAFESYDKVELPFDVRITFTAGGSFANREAFLLSCQAVVGDLNLYDAVMPEAIFPSCNVTHLDFRRTAHNGLGLMIVTLWMLQIREIAGTPLSNTASPTSASQQNDGNVQTTAPTAAQTNYTPTLVGQTPRGSG